MEADLTGESPPGGPRADMARDAKIARRLALARGVPLADVDDVTQEVLIALERLRPGFRPPEGRPPEDAWRALVWAVVERQTASYRRARTLRLAGERGAAIDTETTAPSTEDELLCLAPRVVLRRAMIALKRAAPHLHAVMTLHLDGLSATAIGRRLSIPGGTAWTRVRHARAAMRATVHRWSAQEQGSRRER